MKKRKLKLLDKLAARVLLALIPVYFDEPEYVAATAARALLKSRK